jgi:GLPGLI family protein
MKIIFLILPFFLFSQNNYQVKYKMITLFDGAKNYDAKLSFSEFQSCFEYKLSIKDTLTVETQDENGNLNIVIPETREQKVYFDLKKKKCFEIKYLKTIFIVQDTLSLPNWNILEEVKIINNHSCQKAITTLKGRNYEVWFTLDYPSKYGPWKLNGLPGLILLAQDDTKEVYFEATEIIKTNDKIEVADNSFIKISSEEFELEIKKRYKDIEEKLKAMGDRNTKTDIKFRKSRGLEIAD